MDRLQLTREQLEQMTALARAGAPLEICGLLEGRNGRVDRVLPVPNADQSRVTFRMEGQEFIDAMIACDYEPLAIYHSHPQGPDGLSPTDLARAFYPDSAYIVISLAHEPPRVRAFRVTETSLAVRSAAEAAVRSAAEIELEVE